MSASPLVSVLMPVRNGMPYVESAVRSILSQSFTDFEFLIVDDGSTDETPAVLEKLAAEDSRIRVIRQAGLGIKAALNRGLAVAQGAYLARMDADDLALPARFRLQVDFLESHSEVLAVGGQTFSMDSEGDLLFPVTNPTDPAEIERTLLRGRNPLAHPTTMLRTAALRQVNGYTDDYPVEDYDLWLRLTELGPIANLAECVLHYRLHANPGRIERHQQQLTGAQRVLAAAYARRGLGDAPRLPDDFAPQSVAGIHHHWAMSAVHAGCWKGARKHAWKALRLQPLNPYAWWTFIRAQLKWRISLTRLTRGES